MFSPQVKSDWNPIKKFFHQFPLPPPPRLPKRRWSWTDRAHLSCMIFVYFHDFFMLFCFFCHTKSKYFLLTHRGETKNFILKTFQPPKHHHLSGGKSHQPPASVELELSTTSAPSSHNLLIGDASGVSDFHGLSSSFSANNTSASTHESPQSQQQPVAVGKKESNLFGWFASSSTSTSTSSAVPNLSATSTSSGTPPIAGKRSNDSSTQNGQDEESSPSTKISSKLSYGEKFKFNKNGNKATALDQQAPEQSPGSQKEQQQKSSRRTTSLLNLFMSNSQGKIKNHIPFTILP